MPSKKTLLIAILVVACGLKIAAVPAVAANAEKVLYSFKDNGTDGHYPEASLVFDAAGNLYGTTIAGGADGHGTVFQLAPGASGTWTQTVLHSFAGEGDGEGPAAGLTFNADGNLYGTTVGGGTYSYGTVFELTPGSDTWSETVLHSFAGHPTDGEYPYAGLIFDAAGNLYGTTYEGSVGAGTVFELVPGAGTWTESVLYTFGSNGAHDGGRPYASLIFDAAGNLYSTTYVPGIRGGREIALVFQLKPGAGGSWTERMLYGCDIRGCADQGADARGNVIFDAAGNLYSTTSVGGAYVKNCGGVGCGTVFQLTRKSNGNWTEKVIHSFGNGKDGSGPMAGLVLDTAGNMYGTTQAGGVYGGGTVFRLTLGTNGRWAEKVLHSFGKGKDGANPDGSLILGAAGNLYGTTTNGGAHHSGTVFEITP